MKSICLKKKTVIGVIFLLVCTIMLGCVLNFSNFKQVQAEQNISVSGWDDDSNGDGVYEVNITGGLISSKTSKLQVNITGSGVFSYTYTNTSGSLTVTCNDVAQTLGQSISLTQNSNVIIFTCKANAGYKKGSATVGNFTVSTQKYSINTAVNDSALGGVNIINEECIVGTEISVIATKNDNAMFLGFIDENKTLLSQNTTYTFNVSKSTSITALFSKIDGNNTLNDPLNFEHIISVLNNYFSENYTLNYNLTLNESQNLWYVAENSNYTAQQDGNVLTSSNGVYTFNVNTATTSTISIISGTKRFNYIISNPGLYGSSIIKGRGTSSDPYIIENEQNLQDINKSKSSVFKINNSFSITKNFTPIGTSEDPFTGTLYGDGETTVISGLKTASGNYRGLFGYTNGGIIKNFSINNIQISAKGYSGFLIGYASNKTNISNITVNGTLTATGANIGGIVGQASNDSGVVASNCKVYGIITTSGSGIGGLSGTGGTFTDCVVYASISGAIVGGLTGGYANSKLSNNSNFTRCYVAGEIGLTSHKNNYPYWGLINGYGSWEKYGLTNSGQQLSVNYTSSVGVSKVEIFNVKDSPNGIVITPTLNENGGSFSKTINLTGTYALADVGLGDLANILGGGSIELSETQLTGVTSNYGGFTIRFTMENGTYKYVSTLNRAESKFQSNFNINLDELTSYVDNFSNIEIDTSIGTSTWIKESNTSVWGTAKVDNANDFEHLAWIINGGIPTTFKNVVAYNQRSVATISVSLQKDIDLTAKRYLLADGTVTTTETEGAFVLNTSNGTKDSNVLYQFYGFGNSEMMPYRGSLYGNNHNLTVNMNFPNAYMMGILSISTEQKYGVVVNNLTVNGNIAGNKRVGIVGFFDNYERTGSLTFENVINNATVSGNYQVGGFVGATQGTSTEKPANLYFTNCVNNGNITAKGTLTSTYSVEAGGFVGSASTLSSYTNVILTNCTNAGTINSTGYAGGFVGTAKYTDKDGNVSYAKVTVEGINISKGIVQGTASSHFYVGTTYTRAGSGTLKTLYKLIILNCPQTEFLINNTTYKTDDNASLYVEFIDCETFEGKTISISNTYLNNSLVVTPDPTTMVSTVGNLPTNIVLADNTYETTNDFWTINAIVSFNNGTTLTMLLLPNLTEIQLNSNQLVFVNIGFTNSIYKIPSTMVATLKRITGDVKNYVTSANALISKTNGTNEEFLTLGTDVKTKYDKLKTEIYSYDENSIERFNNYISNTLLNNCNVNVSADILAPYFENIVKTADLSSLQNVNVNYGTTSFIKTLTFVMLATDSNGKNITKSKDITYQIALNGTLNATATTEGITFSVNDIVTYSYNSDITVKINPIDVQIEFTDNEYVYDGTQKTITATAIGLNGDSFECSLLYNGEMAVSNVGNYAVTVESIIGDNAIYYNIPETYTTGSLKITPIIYTLNVEANKQFTYNKQPQATSFSLIKQNESSYNLKDADYTVLYNGEQSLPVNVGTYTAVITLGSNFKLNGSNQFSFVINKKQITNIELKETVFIYNKQVPNFEFQNFEGLVTYNSQTDTTTVTSYTFFDNKGLESNGITVGEYTLQINGISNTNYYIETIIKEFEVKPAEVTITLNSLSSIYGDALILDQLTYTTKDIIYTGDNLNVIAKNIEGTTVGTYPLSATYSNSNYDVTVLDSIYEITAREIEIDYGTTEFEYNGNNQYANIKTTLTNVLESDKTNFIFELTNSGKVTTEFKNAGTYTLALKENNVTSNYKLTENSKNTQNYIINAYNLTLKVKNLEKNYNQAINFDDFGVETPILAGLDKLEQIATLNYRVYNNETLLTDLTSIDVGIYVIKLELLEEALFSNYNIETVDGTLTILVRETYIEASDFEKFYDGMEVVFKAKLFGADNQEITEATIVYTYYQNNIEVSEIVNVGLYTVKVQASAGENNEPCEKIYNITIKTNIVTIILNSTSKEYDAKNFEINYTCTMSKEVDISNILSYKLQNENKEEMLNIKDAGKYYVNFTLSNNNYILTQEEFEVIITPINVNLQISTRTETFGDEFDIQTTSYTSNVNPLQNESFELVYSLTNYTGIVGEYVIKAECKNTNYNVSITNGTLQIIQRELVVKFIGESTLTYNPNGYDNILTADVTNVVTENAFEMYYLNANNQQVVSIVDAGTYYLKIELVDIHNYIFENITGTEITKEITVNKKELNLDIKIQDKIYDGKAIEFNGVYSDNNLVSESLYNIEYYLENTNIEAPTSVGKYLIKITEKISKNYKFNNNFKEFNIISRELSIKNIAKEFEYNRNIIKPQLELLNIVENDDVKLNLQYIPNESTFKEVGEYKILILGITGADSVNYNLISDDEIKYRIIPTQVEVRVKNNKFTFTNKQLQKENLGIEFVGAIDILETDYEISELPTSAGNYDVIISSKNSGIIFNQEKFDIVIEKANIEGIIFENKTVNYNNKAHSILIENLITNEGVALNVEYSANSFVDVGVYEISATLTNENYNTKILTAVLTINSIELDIIVSTENGFTYNKSNQGVEIIGFEGLWYKNLIDHFYVGNNYNSQEKPIDAGEYKLIINAINENNIKVKQSEFNFVINKKALVLQNIVSQTYVYGADEKQYETSFIGDLENDEVNLTILYNNENKLPTSAGEYIVTFGELIGKDSKNYYLQDAETVSTLTINKYKVKVVAENKAITYGNKDVELTYVADNLLANDVYTGNITRESGKNVNSYIISQGSLTAGNNYEIEFTNGVYQISQREITYNAFVKEFVYNAESQIPQVIFNNILESDSNVVKVVTEGDTTNAGEYTLKFVINNINYKLLGKNAVIVTILKKDISEVILNLISSEKDYDGQEVKPFVLIDGNYEYNETYYLHNNKVDTILNAGVYDIVVEIVDSNYKGSKTFEYVVNKINYEKNIIENAKVVITSKLLKVEGINQNISVGTSENNFVQGNTISNLDENTLYNVYVRVEETTNYKTTIFNLGEFKTSVSAERLNKEIEEVQSEIIDNVDIEDIIHIKEILKDAESLSELEQQVLNKEELQELIVVIENYVNGLNEEIKQTKSLSDIVDFNILKTLPKITYFMTFVGAGIIITRRKKDEGEN